MSTIGIASGKNTGGLPSVLVERSNMLTLRKSDFPYSMGIWLCGSKGVAQAGPQRSISRLPEAVGWKPGQKCFDVLSNVDENDSSQKGLCYIHICRLLLHLFFSAVLQNKQRLLWQSYLHFERNFCDNGCTTR